MSYPIPGVGIGTPYGKRGSYWSCNEDAAGNGIHTGVDFPASTGTNIYAPIAGQIRHRAYGSAFGNHQFAISPDPGQPFADGEVFFAHTTTRPKDGIYVQAGDYLADVGAEGNVSGPHLHLEYMPHTKNQWRCGIHADPQPVLDWQPNGGNMGSGNYDYHYGGKPPGTFSITRDYKTLDQSEWSPPRSGWESSTVYLNVDPTFQSGKTVGAIRLRLVREDGDDTGHADLFVMADALDGDGRCLIRWNYWEKGEKGVSTKVQVKCIGGLQSATISTRYLKKSVVVD